MLLRLLKAERLKLKRSPVWLAFLLMPIVPALLGTLNYIGNIDILKGEWYSLWTQHTLFTCYFFLPVMVGVYCAYLMRLEHDQHNWNKMLTLPVQRPLIFLAKLITASAMIMLSELWIGILFVISGKLIGMTTPVPLRSVVIWCLFGTLGGTVMAYGMNSNAPQQMLKSGYAGFVGICTVYIFILTCAASVLINRKEL